MATTDGGYGSGPEAIRAVVDGMYAEMGKGGALPVFGLHVWIDVLEPHAAPRKPTSTPEAVGKRIADVAPGLRLVRDEEDSRDGD